MTTLIGLNGRRGSGKDTAYSFLHEWAAARGVRSARRGFADALKLSFARIFIPNISLDEAVIWCDELKVGDDIFGGNNSQLSIVWQRRDDHGTTTGIQHTITGRQALQRYGTEGHRDVFGDDFWVDALLPTHTFEGEDDAYRIPAWPSNFISGMMDFSSEPLGLAVITDVRFPNEAKRIHQLGGQIWRVYRDGLSGDDSHSSETPLPPEMIDVTIYNGIEDDLGYFQENVCREADERIKFE